jgi:cell division protein FtsB
MRDPSPRRILRSRPSRREALLKRALLWGILALAAVMAIVALSGLAERANAEAQVAAAQARNAALQRTIDQTTQAIATAKSDDEIERAARRWGYIRPGDQTVVIVNGASK